jgi:AAA15 family ATPase/GTPase
MDQDLLRRDEMWVAERDAQGQSQLFSFAEYKELRNDTDIRKRYLQGRLGGTPQILLSGALTSAMDSTPANEGA